MTNTSIDTMARRAYVFELWSRRLHPPEIQRLVAAQHNVSERTVRDDLYKMKEWLPELINLKATSDERAAELIAKSRIIYERLINLGETTNHPFTKMGAYRNALAALKFEADFMQSTGKVDKVPDKLKAEITGSTEIKLSMHPSLISNAEETPE